MEWLHQNRADGCSDAAAKQAAANGHLDVVKWLFENRTEHDAKHVMVNAARSGQLAVLQWVYTSQLIDCASCVAYHVLDVGYRGGALNALQWLQEQPRLGTCNGACSTSRYADLHNSMALCAIHGGDLQLLQYTMEALSGSKHIGNDREFAKLGRTAGSHGHLPIIQYLYDNHRDNADWSELRQSAENSNRREVIAWLDSVTDM